MSAPVSIKHLSFDTVDDLDPSDWDRLRAVLFGELFLLAAPVVKRFTSDLYRDAQRLQEDGFLTGPGQELVYFVRESGTHLFKSDDVPERYPFDDDVRRYRISIRPEGKFRAVITTTEETP